MKFGKHLREKTLKEWRFYTVDYKALKKSLNFHDDTPNTRQFFQLFEECKSKIAKFYFDKEKWALGYMETLEKRVDALREVTSYPSETTTEAESSSDASISSSDGEASVGASTDEMDGMFVKMTNKRHSFGTKQAWLKEEYRRMGSSKQFKAFIYAKKSLSTFLRELDLLKEFLELNKTAFSKILKKFDKRTESSIRKEKMEETMKTHNFLDGGILAELKQRVSDLIDEVNALKPELPEGWEDRKVYTIGCFDLFHRGHQNVLLSLREFGYFIVAGIHDDASYFQLKNKSTIDNCETRINNVKPFVDQIFVIPSTDPLPYIRAMVSEQDIATGSCCYARGDDMLNFPGRDWVESVMPIHFVPRTEACSSSLIRTIYHADSEDLRRVAAFAKTRYDGKPVDENGNVLKSSS